MPTVAETIARSLAYSGLHTVFGLPGGENTELMDALHREGVNFVLVRNESSALFMADVQARLTGKPGVALSTLGPGVANAYAGLAHAWLDRAPVLYISAQTPQHLLDHHTHQVLDTQAVLRPVTKFTHSFVKEDVDLQIISAIVLAIDGRPGPIHLGISSEIASMEDGVWGAEANSQVARSTSIPQPEDRKHTLSMGAVPYSTRPVIVAGLGLEAQRPYDALRQLAEALNAPVIVTPKAKGAIPDDHPLSAGVIGLTRTDPAYEILDEADLIIAIGFDVVELVKPWKQAAPLVWIAQWANEDPKIAAVVEWTGDIKLALTQFLATLQTGRSSTQANWGAQRVEKFRAKLAARTLPTPKPGRMLPQTVLAELRAATPRDIFVATDVGSHKIFFGLEWPAYTPNRYMLSNGLSSMGFGLPAAAAAALTLDEPTICITGDAGFAMVMGELGWIAERDLPVITVVMNDSALDLIRSHQQRAGKQSVGVEFVNPDLMQIASAFGIQGYRVTNASECRAAIQSALASRKPALIEALIDPIGYPTTPVK